MTLKMLNTVETQKFEIRFPFTNLQEVPGNPLVILYVSDGLDKGTPFLEY